MKTPNKDSFIKSIMENFSDKRKNMIDFNDKKISELENDIIIKNIEKDLKDRLLKECSRISSRYDHLKDSCRGKALFLKKREIMGIAEKRVKENLLNLRGSEQYYKFIEKELNTYIAGRESDILIYALEEDFKRVKKIIKKN